MMLKSIEDKSVALDGSVSDQIDVISTPKTENKVLPLRLLKPESTLDGLTCERDKKDIWDDTYERILELKQIQKLPEEKRHLVASVIAGTIADLSPFIGSRSRFKFEVGDERIGARASYTNLDPYLPPDYFEKYKAWVGVIGYDEEKLEKILSLINSNSKRLQNIGLVQLISDTAHELYHHRETHIFPDRELEKKPDGESHALYAIRQKTEAAAEMFTLRYLECYADKFGKLNPLSKNLHLIPIYLTNMVEILKQRFFVWSVYHSKNYGTKLKHGEKVDVGIAGQMTQGAELSPNLV